jgi:surface protein
VENMTGMFEGCQNLTELNIGNWDVSQVEKMKWMFNNCQNLTELNIGDWDVSKVKDVYQMFAQCPVEYIKRRNKLIRI